MKFSILMYLMLLITSNAFSQIKSDTSFLGSEIIIQTSSGNIYGVLTITADTKKSPVVIIIPGSGPTDKDCNSLHGMQTNAYKMLAEGLVEKGISILRFDKRGVGQSKQAMKSQSELRFETYINDVNDWIFLLQKDKRFSKIFLLGHSEGSLIGMVAANQTNIAGFISVSGVAKSADIVLEEQLKTKLSPKLLAESNRILDSLRKGKTVLDVNPSLFAIYKPSVQPYLISWMNYNPIKEFSKMNIPTLIIQGTTDLQVTVNHAKLLSESKPDARLVIINNMNHVLKESGTDIQENMATYSNPDLPLKAELVDEIVNFIKTNK